MNLFTGFFSPFFFPSTCSRILGQSTQIYLSLLLCLFSSIENDIWVQFGWQEMHLTLLLSCYFKILKFKVHLIFTEIMQSQEEESLNFYFWLIIVDWALRKWGRLHEKAWDFERERMVLRFISLQFVCVWIRPNINFDASWIRSIT